MIALGLALPLAQTPRDSAPDGATNVWAWEDGTAMLWETALFISLD